MNVLLCLTVLLAYPDSARLVGAAYNDCAPLGSTSGIRVSVRDSRGRLHLVYSKNWGGRADSCEIFHTFSTDDGVTWSPAKNISRNGDFMSVEAALAIDSRDVLHCVWFQFDDTHEPTGFDYFYSAGCDSGWTVPANISRMSSVSNVAESPSIVVDPFDRVHVAFEMAGLLHGPDIFYTAKSGDSWLTPRRLSDSPLDDGFPALTADSLGVLHACWRIRAADSGYVMYSRHDSAWSPPRRIAACPSWVYSPSLATGPAHRVHLVYCGNTSSRGSDVFYTSTVGDTWSFPLDISVNGGTWSHSSCVSADSRGSLYVTWEETSPGQPNQVFLRRYQDEWLPTTALTDDSTRYSYSPRLGSQVVGGHLDFFWVSDTFSTLAAIWDTAYVYYMRLVSSGAGIEVEAPSPAHAVLWASPNPFRDQLTISFDEPTDRLRRVSVVDASGRRVRRFAPNGGRLLTWDGRGDTGAPVSRGVYFITVVAGMQSRRIRVVRY